jgi:hypothetical protein
VVRVDVRPGERGTLSSHEESVFVAAFCPFISYATDTIRPLDVKLGLWESSTTSEMSGRRSRMSFWPR